MMCLEDFRRLGDWAFRFQYRLGDEQYLSIVSFYGNKRISDLDFSKVLPKINDMLRWLDSSVNEIRLQVIENFPHAASIDIFNTCWLVSFSLIFEINGTLYTQVMYGDEIGCYIGANIIEKVVCDVWLVGL